MAKKNEEEGAKIALEQKELEQEEVHEVVNVLREYGVSIAIGVGAALLIFLGMAVYRSYRSDQALRAAQALASARSLDQLQQIVNSYGSTPSAPPAMLALASQQYYNGDYALAMNTYAEFETKYPEHMMRPAAELGQAYCMEAEGMLEQARERYNRFAQMHPAHFLAPLAIFGQARCFEQEKQFDEARAIYEDFIAENPDSPWAPQAETALLYVDKDLRALQHPPQVAAPRKVKLEIPPPREPGVEALETTVIEAGPVVEEEETVVIEPAPAGDAVEGASVPAQDQH